MAPNDVKAIIAQESIGMDASLIFGICMTESSLNPNLCRYEPNWKYFSDISHFAVLNTQTTDTEKVQQMTSWGLMQVMGSVIRECGFGGPLAALTDPTLGIRYGILQLRRLANRYSQPKDLISAYNAGFPKKTPDGAYVNSDYISKVLRYMNS